MAADLKGVVQLLQASLNPQQHKHGKEIFYAVA